RAGVDSQAAESPRPPGPDRRRLGLALPGQNQSASPTAPGEGASAHAGHELAGPGSTVQTLSAAERPREKPQPRGRGHRAGTQRVYMGYRPGSAADTLSKDHAQLGRSAPKRFAVHRMRRSPGLV